MVNCIAVMFVMIFKMGVGGKILPIPNGLLILSLCFLDLFLGEFRTVVNG